MDRKGPYNYCLSIILIEQSAVLLPCTDVSILFILPTGCTDLYSLRVALPMFLLTFSGL